MFSKEITILDGAMGTMLQQAGLKLGDRPETLSITSPDVVEGIQRRVADNGKKQPFSLFRAKGCFAVPPKFRAEGTLTGYFYPCPYNGRRPVRLIIINVHLTAPRRQSSHSHAGAFHHLLPRYALPCGLSSSSLEKYVRLS